MGTTLAEYYRVREGTSVKLEISIGHGQIGVSSGTVGGRPIFEETKGNVNHDLGDGGSLVKSTLYITTTVTNIQPATNKTSVTYKLSGGTEDFESTLEETAKGQGDVVHYIATFTFYK